MLLPGMVTSFLQSFYYSATKKSAKTIPKSGSATFKRHYNNIYCLVIGVYLLFCIASVFHSNQVNYYVDFGMRRGTFDPKELRSKYRTVSLQLHPDKNPTQEAAEKFTSIKKVYEILSSEDRRLIYDKFGDMQCNGCQSFKDYLYGYLPGVLMFYGFSCLVLVVMNMAGRKDYAQSLRYLSLLAFAGFELYLVTRKNDVLNWTFLADYAVWQKIVIIRESSVYFFIFLSQLGPILFPDEDSQLKEQFKRCQELSGLVEKEMKIHVMASLDPYQENPEMMEKLRRGILKSSVDMKLFEVDHEYKDKYISAVLRKRNQ